MKKYCGSLSVALVMAGCATLQPEPLELTAKQCFDLGVDPFDNTGGLGQVDKQVVGTLGTVDKHCFRDLGLQAPDRNGEFVTGCAVRVDGELHIYASDRKSLMHEWCHVKFGARHSSDLSLARAVARGDAEPADFPVANYPILSSRIVAGLREDDRTRKVAGRRAAPTHSPPPGYVSPFGPR